MSLILSIVLATYIVAAYSTYKRNKKDFQAYTQRLLKLSYFKFKKLDDRAIVPTRAYSSDCGLDLYSLEAASLAPGEGRVFRTGIAGEFNPGYVGYIADRSSMAKKGFKISGGVIDPEYRGELSIVLRNLSNETLTVEEGNKIAQLLIIPCLCPTPVEVPELNTTTRGSNSFGSSGR